MEELTVGACSDFIDDGGLQVDEDGAGDVLPGSSLAEEGVEGIIAAANRLVRGHLMGDQGLRHFHQGRAFVVF